ncbi:hypothetical protein EDD15DRAFT_1468507 [Pisolithus albus]|nr:hypothetical protein EDD15DRAFT_1468507 [Pisolithus albus]
MGVGETTSEYRVLRRRHDTTSGPPSDGRSSLREDGKDKNYGHSCNYNNLRSYLSLSAPRSTGHLFDFIPRQLSENPWLEQILRCYHIQVGAGTSKLVQVSSSGLCSTTAPNPQARQNNSKTNQDNISPPLRLYGSPLTTCILLEDRLSVRYIMNPKNHNKVARHIRRSHLKFEVCAVPVLFAACNTARLRPPASREYFFGVARRRSH